MELLVILIGFFLLLLYICVIKARQFMDVKQDTIKDYIEEYLKEYRNSHLVELNTKIKLDDAPKMSLAFATGISILVIIFIYIFKFILRENLLIGCLICIFLVIIIGIIYFLTKGPTIKKISLKNNIVELYDSKDEIKTYQLDEINIKYNIRFGYKSHKYINIYLNNDIYTSNSYNVYKFEPYIAFVILVNLLKTNDTEGIDNINNDDIKKLQQKFTYSEE